MPSPTTDVVYQGVHRTVVVDRQRAERDGAPITVAAHLAEELVARGDFRLPDPIKPTPRKRRKED